MRDFTATISKDSPRYQEWIAVLNSDVLPLKSPYPQMGMLPGGPAKYYPLALDDLTSEQRERLIDHLSEKFGLPRFEVVADLETIGCPIRAEEVTVTIHNPLKWL